MGVLIQGLKVSRLVGQGYGLPVFGTTLAEDRRAGSDDGVRREGLREGECRGESDSLRQGGGD